MKNLGTNGEIKIKKNISANYSKIYLWTSISQKHKTTQKKLNKKSMQVINQDINKNHYSNNGMRNKRK